MPRFEFFEPRFFFFKARFSVFKPPFLNDKVHFSHYNALFLKKITKFAADYT